MNRPGWDIWGMQGSERGWGRELGAGGWIRAQELGAGG